MDHEKIKAALSEYLDGELPAQERERIETHLASCPDCRESVEAWRRLSRAFFQPAPAEPADERERFVQALMARLPAEDEPAPWRWLIPALGFSFALFALSFLPSQQEQTDPIKTLLLADAGTSAAQSADSLEELMGFSGDER